jgi:peptidoglycan/LPS O-acetylase OafA/YrhL
VSAAAAGTPPAPGDARPEYAALHVIKAAAILAVVVNHAGPFGFSAKGPGLDRVLRSGWLDFHVPAFVFVSGFLYHRLAPIPWREVGRRLARIVPPYLVASLIGIAIGILQPKHGTLFALATGSASGIYYYVFVMALLIPLTWPMSRLPRRAVELGLALLLLHLVLASFWRPLLPIQGWFWGVRNPLVLAPCFLAGWLAHAHLPALAAYARRHAALALGASLCVIVLYIGLHESLAGGPRRLARFAYTCAVIAAIALAWAGRAVPRPVRALSDATLTIYLYHILVYQGIHYLGGWPPALRVPALAALGLAGGLAVASAGRALFAGRSRLVTGA